MNARLLPLLAIVVSLRFSAVSAAGALPDYIRFAEDEKSARLEVAIKSFTMPSGQKVDLIGVVHIADDAYYEGLNRRFDAYDSVLFELVGDPKRVTENAPPSAEQRKTQPGNGAIGFIQVAASEYLQLTFQLNAIDYTRKNMVHADTTAEQFEKMQRERGETMVTLFVRAMQAQMNGQVNTAAMNELDTFGLIRILMSQDSASEFKKALAKMFDQMESITAAIEGKDGSVILGGRNAVVVKKIKEVLANKRQRRIAVFFGGAHMPGIEASLIKDLNAKAAGEEWLAAWTMPKQKPTK